MTLNPEALTPEVLKLLTLKPYKPKPYYPKAQNAMNPQAHTNLKLSKPLNANNRLNPKNL